MRSCGQPSVNRSAGTMRRLAASAPGSAAGAKISTLRAAAACGPQGLLRSGARDLSLHPPAPLDEALSPRVVSPSINSSGGTRRPPAAACRLPVWRAALHDRDRGPLARRTRRSRRLGDWNSSGTFSRELTLWELMGFV